ncbi:MAG TPA: EamA family transporter [Myxococcaceae bacterium]|nr:EamA family transporter [Myxococcaceae bacterium]
MIAPRASHPRADSVHGALYGLAAALLFGLSAPLAKLLLPAVQPLALAALLYLGGGAALALYGAFRRAFRRTGEREARLARSDLPYLVGVIVSGGIVGPLLMLTGLDRLSALSTSLLLNLEGPFTVLFAVAVFREHLGWRAAAASVSIFAGAILLGVRDGELRGDWIGMACVAGACAAWALDNNLTQRLSLKDPVAVVRWKALGAGGCMLLVALATGGTPPSVTVASAAVTLGAVSYGISILLDVYALRMLGAAREAAYFATAPFIGAVAAVPLLGERPSPLAAAAATLMVIGVALLLRERHAHPHTHAPLEHDHLHVHDEHHQHEHPGPVTEPHSHWHRHERLTHEHPHLPDLHHRHPHH